MDNQKWWHQQGNGNVPKVPKEKFSKAIVIFVIVAFVAVLLFTSFYTVNDKQQAVVTTFGKVTSVEDPGMHFKLPFGVQKATLVDVNVYRKIEIGYRSNEGMPAGNAVDSITVDSESKMISGDYNIVNCDFFLEYKISDPVKYLYNSKQPDEILKSLAQSHIRDVISSYNVEEILTTHKGEIQTKIKDGIQNELVTYDLGLVVTDIKLQDSEPPTEQVKAAFKDVETAKQEKETAKNMAEAYQNSQLPKAEAEAERLRNEASLWKQNRINEANMQVAMFNAMYEEYAKNPSLTKKRMFFEMVEKVLPDAKVYIDTSKNGGIQTLLPIEKFN